MRRLAAEAAGIKVVSKGLVTSYDPNTYTAKVTLQPSGIETGSIPVKTLWLGNLWGLFCPPSNGDQVEVIFEDGLVECGTIHGGIFSDQQRPLPVPQGEFWLVHQSGSSLKFTNDMAVSINSAGALNITVAGNASLVAAGTVTVQGSTINLN
jgi:phage baseplate assembly protein gpV